MKFTVKFTYTVQIGQARLVFPCLFHTESADKFGAELKVKMSITKLQDVKMGDIVDGWVRE